MDWQTIEGAPKDQSRKERLLGYSLDLGIIIMRYSGWGEGSGPFETFAEAGLNGGAWIDIQVTHWMPLPAAPNR